MSTPERLARVRTFKPRRRRLSPARQALMERLAPHWIIEVADTPLDLGDLFGNPNPVVLDIGIGIGESCTAMANDDPSVNIIGGDVHTPGIVHALSAIDAEGLANLRLYHGDVFDLIDRLPDRSLSGIRIYFPDPWPKARHHRRRLVSQERIATLLRVLMADGGIHVATDIDDYADQVLDVCGNHPELSGGVIDRPASRPLTRFERRGLDAGRHITDMWFIRTTSVPVDRVARPHR